MSRNAVTSTPLATVLAERWSPRAFDPTREPDDRQLRAVFEAATWAPSANNIQPWRFLVGRRGDDTYQGIFDALVPFNQEWAHSAPVLFAGIAHTVRPDGNPHSHAAYDLGQAVAHLTVQAQHEGLRVHQMGGFVAERLRETFDVPEDFEPFVVGTIGYVGDPATLSERLRERETGPRVRRPVTETVFAGAWEKPAEF